MTGTTAATPIEYQAASPLSAPRNWAISYLVPVKLRPDLTNLTHVTLGLIEDAIKTQRPDIFVDTIAPAQSFLDDITLRQVGRGGRPLIASLSANRCDTVVIEGFGKLNYSAEGRDVSVQLKTPHRLQFKVADALILFANGDAFHALSLSPSDELDSASALYCLLALQQLVMPAVNDELRFVATDQTQTLAQFSQQRLRKLAAARANTGILTTDPVAKYVDSANLVTERAEFCMVAIDDEAWAKEIDRVRSLDLNKMRVHEPTIAGPHLPEANAPELNVALALAGFVQGVCDIPFQSASELSDALTPLYQKEGLSVYHSRHMIVEIASDWRTLRELQDNIGACPYALCTSAVSHFNARLVDRAEATISDLISDQGSAFAEPMPQLRRMLHDSMRQLVAGPSSSLRALIEQRIALFEHVFAQRITDLFRYDEERLVMSRIEERLGVKARFEHTLLMISEFNSLLDDVIELGSSASGRRIGFLLLLLSLLSLVSVVADSVDLLELNLSIPVKAALLGLSVTALIALTGMFALRDYSAWREESRRRNARNILKSINRRSRSKRSKVE